MRIFLSSTTHYERLSKSLKKALDYRGFPITLGKSRELTARLLGYADAHDLHRQHTSQPPSPWDDALTAVDVANRRSHYVATLEAAGIAHRVAVEIIDTIRPTGRRDPDQVDWMLENTKGPICVSLTAWPGKLDEFRRSEGYNALQTLIHAATADDRYWPEHAVARLYPRGAPWFLHILVSMRNQAHHPLWAPAIANFLGGVFHQNGAWQSLCAKDTATAIREVIEQADVQALSDVLAHGMDDNVRRVFTTLALQFMPDLIASKASRHEGHHPPDLDVMVVMPKPWKAKGDFSLSPGWTHEWDHMGSGDFEVWCADGFALDVPDIMYFRAISGPDDPALKILRGRDRKLGPVIADLFGGSPSDAGGFREAIVFALDRDGLGQPWPSGLFQVTHRPNLRERLHRIVVDQIAVAPDIDPDYAPGVVTALCHEMSQMSDEWFRVLPPASTLKIEVELGTMARSTRSLLTDSFEMLGDSLDEQHDTIRTEVSVVKQQVPKRRSR